MIFGKVSTLPIDLTPDRRYSVAMRCLIDKATGDRVEFRPMLGSERKGEPCTAYGLAYISAESARGELVIPHPLGKEVLRDGKSYMYMRSAADRLYAHLWLMGWDDEQEMAL